MKRDSGSDQICRNGVEQTCRFVTSDLHMLAHLSPLKHLELHLEPFVRKSWSLAHHFPMHWPGHLFFFAASKRILWIYLITAAIVMNSEYVFAKLSASHFSLILKTQRQLVEFKEGSASGSVFGFSWASFSFIWFCDNGKSEITRTLCELLVELSYQLGCIIIQCVRHVLHD